LDGVMEIVALVGSSMACSRFFPKPKNSNLLEFASHSIGAVVGAAIF